MEYMSRKSLMNCSDDEFNSYVQAVIRSHNCWMLATGLLAILAWFSVISNQNFGLLICAFIDTSLFCALFFTTKDFAFRIVPEIVRDRQAIHEYVGQFKGKDS